MTKKSVSPERHEEIGAQLHGIQRYATQLAVELGNAYPKNSPVARKAAAVDKAISKLRSEAEDCLYKEVGHDAFSTKTYYPGGEPVIPVGGLR